MVHIDETVFEGNLVRSVEEDGITKKSTVKYLPQRFVIQSETLLLRPPQSSDIRFVFEAATSLGFCDGMPWEAPESEADCHDLHSQAVGQWKSGEAYTFTIVIKDRSQFGGRIAMETLRFAPSLGFWMHPLYQNRGYMSEAVQLMVDTAFSVLHLPVLQASHADWNFASRKVLEKSGFRFCGRVARGLRKRGEWIPEDRLRLTRSDWAARRIPPIAG